MSVNYHKCRINLTIYLFYVECVVPYVLKIGFCEQGSQGLELLFVAVENDRSGGEECAE